MQSLNNNIERNGKALHDSTEWMNDTVNWWRQKNKQERHRSEEKWDDDATDDETSVVEEEKQGDEGESCNGKSNIFPTSEKREKRPDLQLARACEGKECDTGDEMYYSDEEFTSSRDFSPEHHKQFTKCIDSKEGGDGSACVTQINSRHLKPNQSKHHNRTRKMKKELEKPKMSAEALRAKKKSDEDFRKRQFDLQERLKKAQKSHQESGGVIGATERAQRKVKAKQKALAVVMTSIFGCGKDVWGKAQRSSYFTDEEKAMLISMERSKCKLEEILDE